MYPAPIILNPETTPEYAVIWLHGLGADGNDFVPLVPELRLPDTLPIRFVFPQASIQPVTVNAGLAMPAWYDITDPDLTRAVDATGIERSVVYVEQLLRQQGTQGIPLSRIVLAGFSQGGVIALRTALGLESPLLGVLALSTYLPLRDPGDRGDLDIFIGHGQFDAIAPISIARAMCRYLQAAGNRVLWREYTMAHSVNAEEILDIGAWLRSLFSC